MTEGATQIEYLQGRLEPLRQRLLGGRNDFCFAERQAILAAVDAGIDAVPAELRYASALERLLAELSTPIEPDDVLAGRMLEGPPGPEGPLHGLAYFSSPGHTTLDWATVLEEGLEAVARRARRRAAALGTRPSGLFANNVERCCGAIVAFAARYARAAREAATRAAGARRAHLRRMAAALDEAPAGPARDFFAAVQALWLVQFVTSCVIGSRDFAYGRLDQYLLPLYRAGLEDGSLSRELARLYLAHLFIKTKEITGTATDNYQTKPVPCHASNQYAVIGGVTPSGESAVNELSYLVLEAVPLADVPQPEINVRVGPDTPPEFLSACARAVATHAPQIQFWNDGAVLPTLAARYPAVSLADARDYALTACNRINFPGKENITAGEHWHVMPRWLLAALDEGRDPVSGQRVAEEVAAPSQMRSLDDLLAAFGSVARAQVREAVRRATESSRRQEPPAFHFESVLLGDCLERCRDARAGGIRYATQFHLFGGVATVADSLMAIKRLVYEEGRLDLAAFVRVVRDDFSGEELLRQEIFNHVPRFGNDRPEVDELARQVSTIAFDALEAADNPDGHLLFPALYSLHHHMRWGAELPATPDGRRAGEPLSENQSPVHGSDRAGITALLKSVARLPHERAPMGGLNVRFGGRLPDEAFVAVLTTFFALGGATVGYTQVDRARLQAAQEHPERHRSLCVRITGFSEYFVSLSPQGQKDIVDRTAY
ncbi:MAG: pyruvate formate lyase family protein [Gemmatimonadota bacterium]